VLSTYLFAVEDLRVLLYEGGSVWTLLGVLVAASIAVSLLYRRAFSYLGFRRLFILVLFRLTAIVLLLILLFRPVLSFHQQRDETAHLIVLIDTSQSMSTPDGTGDMLRLDDARTQLARHRDILADHFILHVFRFDSTVSAIDSDEQMQTLTPTGTSTQLGRAINRGVELIKPDKADGIIMFTDGSDNSNRPPMEDARKRSIRIYALATGSDLRQNPTYKDVIVETVEAAEEFVVNDIAKVTAQVEAIGLGSSVVDVTLYQKDKQLATAQLTLDDRPGTQPLELTFTPTEIGGPFEYEVRIPRQTGEQEPRNNQQTFSASVVDAKLRVLYLEGTLRPEVRPLISQFLAKDPHIEFCSMVLVTPQAFQFRTNIKGLERPAAIFRTEEELKRFDVFLLGDVDSSILKVQAPILAKLVKEGKGLIMMGGSHSFGPGGYAASPLAKALPVVCGPRSTGQVDEPFIPRLTPEGLDHPILHKITDYFRLAGNAPKKPGLPRLLGCTIIPEPKVTATVLAEHPTRSVGRNALPILVVHPYGSGRAIAFAGDTTWRWHQTLKGLGKESPYLKFWGQMVRWAGGVDAESDDAPAGVTAKIAKTAYKPGEQITIRASVREAEGQGTNYAHTEATVEGPMGDPVRVVLSNVQPGPAGRYRTTFDPPLPGDYKVTIAATLKGRKLGSDSRTFRVGRPNLEYVARAVNMPLLAGMARATGGRSLPASKTKELFESLEAGRRQSIGYEEVDAYDPRYQGVMWVMWGLFIGLLTLEWTFRKRWQLH